MVCLEYGFSRIISSDLKTTKHDEDVLPQGVEMYVRFALSF